LTSDIDELAAELEATLEEPEPSSASSPDKAQAHNEKVTMLNAHMLYEAVERMIQSADETNKDTRAILHAIADAPNHFKHSANNGVVKALDEFRKKDKELRALDRNLTRRFQKLKRESLLWMVGGVAVGALFFMALALLSFFYFGPKISEYAAYSDTHTDVREGSLFGAQLGNNDGLQFIMFDEGVEVKTCRGENGVIENCVIIKP